MEPSIQVCCTHRLRWQKVSDLAARRKMLLKILFLLRSRYGRIGKRVSNIARRAELALYTRANSLAEYKESKTLLPRIQSLIRKLHANQINASVSFSSEPVVLLGKRTFDSSNTSQVLKRRRIIPSSRLLRLNFDTMQHVMSFVSQRDLTYTCITNKAGSSLLTQLVSSMSVKPSFLASMSLPQSSLFFKRWTSLKSLSISGHESLEVSDAELLSPTMNVESTIAVRNLMYGLRHSHNSSLRTLQINCAYVDDLTDRATECIAQSLLHGACPNLTSLALRGNCISDNGALYLARVIYLGSCSNLSSIDLSHNAIGERGSVILSDLITKSSNLRFVNLSKNFLQQDRMDHLENLMKIGSSCCTKPCFSPTPYCLAAAVA